MNQPWQGLALGVALVVGLLTGSVRMSAGAPEFPILVVLDDRAAVLPRVLDQAQKEASRIFWHDGVSISWLPASESSGSSLASEDLAATHHTFAVRLIVQPRLRRNSVSNPKFLLGAAPASPRVCSGEAYVFFDQIVEFAGNRRADVATVMGTAAAHEIGHLLLRHQAHAPEGLMRAPWRQADWNRAALGLLLFSPSEGSTMHATISSCGTPSGSG